MLKSLRVRLTALAAIWTVSALLAGGFVLSYAFEQTLKRNFDQRMESTLLALVSSVDYPRGGTVNLARPITDERFSQVFSGWYWQVSDGPAVLLRSRSLWDQNLKIQDADFDDTGRMLTSLTGPRNQRVELLTRQIFYPDHPTPLTFVVTLPSNEILSELESFNTLLSLSLGILGAGLLFAIFLQVSLGLQPLRRLRHDLNELRAGRSEQLETDYPGEVSPLVESMNAVLATNADVVRRARARAADLAHGLKTSLSIIRTEAAKSPPETRARLDVQISRMQRILDHHLARAASGADQYTMARTQVSRVAEELRTGLMRLFADRSLKIDVDISPALYVRCDRGDLEEMLGNLLENACKWTRTTVWVKAEHNRGLCHIRIEDDGPGLTLEEIRNATERGRRFDERENGSGLGLSIANELAVLYAGELRLEPRSAGGLTAELILPAVD